ncbi:MAG TPA: S-adenosylmethionine:tRNA ribosyltransferase-isomerase [Acidimicrobiales bacterium]|nr:S-adenosylmethionine:tRNA ribosyltransferase-isomerase [Acidimicrobiales bacterium]
MQTLVVLDSHHAAHEPREARGVARDNVAMLVSPGSRPPVHSTFRALPEFLSPGDLVVVNTSGTVPAAIDAQLATGATFVLHVSTELPGGLWMVEPRRLIAGGATEPFALAASAIRIRLDGGTEIDLLRPAPGSARLWLAAVVGDEVLTAVLHARGRPIRYRYVDHDWPIDAYQTIFADRPGSAEMPSAARPFSDALVTSLVRRGVSLAPITLHTGVSSLEGHEMPYPERFDIPTSTAAAVNAVHASGGHVIAVGTTVVRALETAVDARGTVHPAAGWTDTVITPERGVRAVDGLITGWHEPDASHLAMLEAVAGRAALVEAYAEASSAGYLWHEFGDSHLLLPYADRR